ncbi:arabinosyltransferase domain-containing protein, partial [Planctomycetota bacterium]
IVNRPSLALVGSGVAFLFAVMYALGPAIHAQTEYAWSPDGQRQESGSTVVPLILSAGSPESIDICLPCSSGSSLSTAEGTQGLALKVTGGAEHIVWNVRDFIGREATCRDVACLSLRELHWEVRLRGQTCGDTNAGGGTVLATGVAKRSPQVHFLRLDGPATTATSTTVRVVTRPHGSTPSWRQYVFGCLSAFLALSVLTFVWRAWGSIVADSARCQLRPVSLSGFGSADALVLIATLAWIVLGPPLYDDGWVLSRLSQYAELGEFSTYYDKQATEVPFGFWLDWLLYAWASANTTPVFLRLPIALVVLATWGVLRWTFPDLGLERTGTSQWVAAAAYVTGVMAWTMTLRPEPVIALAAVLVLGLTVSFHRSADGRLLLSAVLVGGLTCTVHPSGMVAVGPLLVAWRPIWKWLREGGRPRFLRLGACLVASLALTVIVFFLGTDVSGKRAAIAVFRTSSEHSFGPAQELLRYTFYQHEWCRTTMRAGWVGLLLLVATVFSLRALCAKNAATSLPGKAVVAGMLILSVMPSKWPWHFGALVGLVALALAVEFAMLREGRHVWTGFRAFATLCALVVLATWSFRLGQTSVWNAGDLQTLDWRQGGVGGLALDLAHPASWLAAALLCMVTVCFARLLRGRRLGVLEANRAIPAYFFLLIFAVWVSVTSGTLIADTVLTESWTFLKQNLAALTWQPDCGLAEQVRIPAPGSLHAMAPAAVNHPHASYGADRAIGALCPPTAGFEVGWFAGRSPFRLPHFSGAVGSRPPRNAAKNWSRIEAATETNTGSYRSQWYLLDPTHQSAL